MYIGGRVPCAPDLSGQDGARVKEVRNVIGMPVRSPPPPQTCSSVVTKDSAHAVLLDSQCKITTAQDQTKLLAII